jgi:hypothetical protein
MKPMKPIEYYYSLDLDVYDRHGKFITSLNSLFACKHQLSEEQIAAWKETHIMRASIFKQAALTKDSRKLKLLATLFEELEFQQQNLLGLTLDKSFHRWYELPGCTCPKMDNSERFGFNQRIINITSCPVHSKPERKKKFKQLAKMVTPVITPLIKEF